MQFDLHRPLSGVSVPVSALRSKTGCGVGEFSDLKLLGAWCREVGLSLIQILPVNDTGRMTSPYSAISSFALHPLYIRLQDVPGVEPWLQEIELFRQMYNEKPRTAFQDVLSFKLSILNRIYEANKSDLLVDELLESWIDAHPWIRPYAVFYDLKMQYDHAGWLDWPDHQELSLGEIDAVWEAEKPSLYFYAWVQFHLERQFVDAFKDLERCGVYLKGDIPILMNDDSVDVWAYRSNFDLTLRAGAPPDMFATTGQHWGFPTYNWVALEAADFAWWKARLRQAERFYHAYRLDHVLGFFRIWSIPNTESTAVLGFFDPASYLSRADLEQAGFAPDQIRQFITPHLTYEHLAGELGDEADRIAASYFQPDPSGFLLAFRLETEKEIQALDESDSIKHFLTQCHWKRVLLPTGLDLYTPAWFFRDASAYHRLNDEEKGRLQQLIDTHREESERIWEAQGRKLLMMLQETTAMLPCAEDLGEVPDCVPDVLADLEILSLKIERWTDGSVEEEGPFMHPGRYPRLSVCTPSVHDTSTLRGWWEEEHFDPHVRQKYYEALGFEGPCPDHLTPETAEAIIRRNLESGSVFSIFQIQDLLAVEEALHFTSPNDERINVPGTVNDGNWSYRIGLTLEDLSEQTAFNAKLNALLQPRACQV